MNESSAKYAITLRGRLRYEGLDGRQAQQKCSSELFRLIWLERFFGPSSPWNLIMPVPAAFHDQLRIIAEAACVEDRMESVYKSCQSEQDLIRYRAVEHAKAPYLDTTFTRTDRAVLILRSKGTQYLDQLDICASVQAREGDSRWLSAMLHVPLILFQHGTSDYFIDALLRADRTRALSWMKRNEALGLVARAHMSFLGITQDELEPSVTHSDRAAAGTQIETCDLHTVCRMAWDESKLPSALEGMLHKAVSLGKRDIVEALCSATPVPPPAIDRALKLAKKHGSTAIVWSLERHVSVSDDQSRKDT